MTFHEIKVSLTTRVKRKKKRAWRDLQPRGQGSGEAVVLRIVLLGLNWKLVPSARLIKSTLMS